MNVYIERIKKWKKSNIVFIVLLFLIIYMLHADGPADFSLASFLTTVVFIVVLTLPYAIMIIIIDIATSKTNQVLEKRSEIKKEQKAVEKKEVENIDLDL
jgi:predicted membrane protein